MAVLCARLRYVKVIQDNGDPNILIFFARKKHANLLTLDMFCLALGTELSQDDDAPLPCEGSEDLAFCATGRRAEFCDLSQLLISCALVAVQLVRMTLRMRSRPLK